MRTQRVILLKQNTLVVFFKNKYKTILCKESKILTCLSIEVCDLTVESIEFDKIIIKFQFLYCGYENIPRVPKRVNKICKV